MSALADAEMAAPVENSDDKKIEAVRQVEFYFGDSNLPFDKFMWTLHTKNPDNWVPLNTVASFKRMREYSSFGLPWLVDALRNNSTFLQVDEKGDNIRRMSPVKEPVGAFDRSVYAKGFPDEDPSLQKKIEQFFAQYGPINQVRMRRDDTTKMFKKSVFAEFADVSHANAFLEADPKPAFEGVELLIMSKDAYVAMKCKEKGITGKDVKKRQDNTRKPRGFNAFAEMRKEKTRASKGEATKPKEIYLEFMGNKIPLHVVPNDKGEDGSSTEIPEGLQPGDGYVVASEVPITNGATLRFTFKDHVSELAWKDLKLPLKSLVDNRAPFIKFKNGENTGLVSFHRKLEAAEIEKVKETLPTLSGNDIEWALANDEDEKAFQIERAQTAAKSALSASSGVSSNHGAGRGGKRGGRGRGGASGAGRQDRRAEKKSDEAAGVGEKRTRAVEPDGGPDVGTRGVAGPPVIMASVSEESASKKPKLAEGEAS